MNKPKSRKQSKSRGLEGVAIGARVKRLVNDKYFRLLTENSFDSTSLVSKDGKVIYQSPSLALILGYKPEERLEQSAFDLIHPEDMLRAKELFDQLLQQPKGKLTTQIRFRNKRGRWIWLELTAINLLAEPEVKSLIFNYRDISERKDTDLMWRILSSAVEQTADPIMITNADGKIEYVNTGFTNVTGYTSEEIIGRNPKLLKSGTHSIQYYKDMWDTILAGKTWYGTLVNRKKDGEIYFAETTISPIYSPEGSIVNFVSVEKDVTGRMKAEEKSRRVEARLQTTLDSMLEGCQIIGLDWRYLYVNDAAAAQGNATKEGLLGHTLMDAYPGIENTELFTILRQCTEDHTPRRFENESNFPNASRKWLEFFVQPIPEGLFIFSIDITERKRAELNLKQKTTELETLYKTTLEINQQIELNSLLDIIVERAATLVGVENCGLYLIQPDGRTLKLAVGYHMPAKQIGIEVKFGEGLSGKVAQSGELLVIEDYQTWDGRIRDLDGVISFRRVLGIPLKVRDNVIGVITVADLRQPGPFSYDEIRLVKLFADQAAIAIDKDRLLDDVQRHLHRTRALRKIDQSIAGTIDVRVVLEVVLQHTIAELGVDAAIVLLYDPNEKILKYGLGRGLRTNALEFTHLRLGEGYAGRAALGRETIYITDLQRRTTDFLRSPTFQQEGFVCYLGVPLIAKGEIKGVLEIFHRSPLDPDRDWLDFMEALAGQIAIAFDNASLYSNLQRSNMELNAAYSATIEGWSKALDLRDKETEGHTQRVTKLTMQLAQLMNISGDKLIHIYRGALLHDIGKLGVPDNILLKPDKLTDDEWKIMRKHPAFAYELLSPIAYLHPALSIPYCHHEKWDGSGYPRGLKGEEIPLEARIFAVVDVWDALTSDRPYRPAWTMEKALEYIRQGVGSHFDPEIVEKFISMVASNH